ncbi:hypothetical protein AAUPMG_06928, partial [Pasteurella multocida subsp. multocida str. Anand1_goat]
MCQRIEQGEKWIVASANDAHPRSLQARYSSYSTCA